MKYPEFFNQVESIELYDPISEFLGVFEEGILSFNYLDVVKSAGHSCPTVAGAYLVTLKALKYLYPDSIPERGSIHIAIQESFSEGVTGVISNVFSQITGATELSGFKGIAGKFVRHSLMDFDADISGQYKFTRKDNGTSVELIYQPAVAVDPRQQALMQKSIMGRASDDEKALFGKLWQERVRAILIDLHDDPSIIRILS
ncbi:MAG: hypothetical protein GQ527_02575 [Bacteroidales bacterium]|nr:hypothetical protein [Bacteroidales bacterium]